jgi:hypothetical protein
MTADRLNAWIHKIVPGGVRLQLVFEQGLTGGVTIASWTREEVDESRETPIPGGTIGDQVIEAANEHANNVNDSCKFLLQWVHATGAPLRTMIHRAAATDGAGGAAAVGSEMPLSLAQVFLQAQQQFLGHISQQQRVINGSIGVVLTAFERGMAMQQRMLDTIAARLDALPAPNEEVEEVTRLKIHALEKAVELGPDVMRLAIAAAGRALGQEPPPDGPNGVS